MPEACLPLASDMSKAVIHTQAGDDSDGKIWGIEGLNILFILTGLITSVGLTLLLFRQPSYSATYSFTVGSIPFVVLTAYVFGFRQGKPRAFDTDLLETLFFGTGWMPSRSQPLHPLYRHECS